MDTDSCASSYLNLQVTPGSRFPASFPAHRLQSQILVTNYVFVASGGLSTNLAAALLGESCAAVGRTPPGQAPPGQN